MLALLSSPVCFPGVTNSDRKTRTVLCAVRPARPLLMASTVKGTAWQVRPLQVRLLDKSGSVTSQAYLPFLLLSVLCPPPSGEAALPIFLFRWTLLSSFFWANNSVQSLNHVQFFATPWTAARQASLSITTSQSLPRLMSIEMLMPSNHLILWHPLLLLPSSFPNIRVFSNELALHIRWPKYRRFSL